MEQQNWLPGGAHLIVEGDPRQTLINCEGLYECPTDTEGYPIGPIVGYAGTYQIPNTEPQEDDSYDVSGADCFRRDTFKHYVGLAYYNYSMADQWPAVNRWFARQLAYEMIQRNATGSFNRASPRTVILGAPMAGIKFSAALAEELGARHIFAEKKTLKAGMPGERDEEELRMLRYDIHPGDEVFIGEELVNNFSTTKDLVAIIEEAGGIYMGITCVINRSWPEATEFMGKPIYSVLHVPTEQYRQDNPLIVAALEGGFPIIGKPKHEWPRLRAAMDAAQEHAMSDGEER